jgi:hypothetical protein
LTPPKPVSRLLARSISSIALAQLSPASSRCREGEFDVRLGFCCRSSLPRPESVPAFDLIEIDGRDLRGEPIEARKTELARLLTGCQPLAVVLNRVFEEPGPVVFEHAYQLGCEGIVSKRRGSRYARGRTHDWLKVKNPDAPGVQRERKSIGADETEPARRRSPSRPNSGVADTLDEAKAGVPARASLAGGEPGK